MLSTEVGRRALLRGAEGFAGLLGPPGQWAIRFYQNHGFRLVAGDVKDTLLRRYWSIPDRQIEESVVLADARWLATSSTMSA